MPDVFAGGRPDHSGCRSRSRSGSCCAGSDEYDGAGVYIRQLVDAFLALDHANEYVLLYARKAQSAGTLTNPTA